MEIVYLYQQNNNKILLLCAFMREFIGNRFHMNARATEVGKGII